MSLITNTNLFKILIIFLWNAVIFSTSESINGKINANPYEYIVEHTPDRMKLLSEQVFENGIPDELINLFAPVTVENELCRKQSLLLKNSLKKFDVWALKMWDSSGKLPSGLLNGHFYELGNFNECLGVPEIGPYHVKYCLIEVQNFLAPAIYHSELMRSRAAVFGSVNIIKDHLYLARCVPASCRNEDLEKHYSSTINQYNMSVIINKHACTASNEDLLYNVWDWGTLIFLIFTTVLVTASTAIDKFLYKTEEKVAIYPGILISSLLCFSLYKNSYQILTKETTKTKLSFINGLKGLAIILVIMAHLLVTKFFNPMIDYLQITKDYSKPTILDAMAATFNLSVDGFLVIGGFLLSYIEIRNIKSGRNFNPSVYYTKRFLRILPPYAVQIALFVSFVYRYGGSGPLWKINMGLSRDNCLKNWWTNLLFINNYVNQDEMCISPNWYLAVYMQLIIISPLILLPMNKWKAFRRYFIPLLIVISSLWTFYISYTNNYRAGPPHDIKIENTNQYIYIITQSRFGSWLMGLYLGYVIFKIEGNSEHKVLPKDKICLGWILTILIHILAFLSLSYFMSQDEHSNLIDALYNGFHRIIYASAICWIIYACALGYGGFLHTLLTWYPLQVMGRLSFMAYLSHMLVVYGIDSMTLVSLQYNPIIDLVNAFGRVLIVFIQSFFLSVLFEMPYANLARTLSAAFNKEDPSRPKQQLGLPEVKEKDDKKYPKIV